MAFDLLRLGIAFTAAFFAGAINSVAGGGTLISFLGGYGAVGVAKRIGKIALGRFVIAVGFTVSAVFLVRAWW